MCASGRLEKSGRSKVINSSLKLEQFVIYTKLAVVLIQKKHQSAQPIGALIFNKQ